MRLVITCMAHGRHEILRLWCLHIRKISNRFKKEIPDLEIIGHVCGGVKEVEIALMYGMRVNYSDNYPLSKKANNRIKYIEKIEPDYVLFLGSDDFINHKLINYYLPYMKEGIDEIAPLDIYYFDVNTKTNAYSPGYHNHRKGEALAVGRMLSKKLLDKLSWKLWRGLKHRGIDSEARDSINSIPHTRHHFYLKNNRLVIVDVKTDESLNKFIFRPHFQMVPNMLFGAEIPELNELIQRH